MPTNGGGGEPRTSGGRDIPGLRMCPPWTRAGASWLIAGGHLLGALVLTWRLWADPASRAQVGDIRDVDLFAWFLRYTATAVAHGHLPALVTTAMNAPRGINIMGNTSFLLPGMLLTPVTLLACLQVSVAIVLDAGLRGLGGQSLLGLAPAGRPAWPRRPWAAPSTGSPWSCWTPGAATTTCSSRCCRPCSSTRCCGSSPAAALLAWGGNPPEPPVAIRSGRQVAFCGRPGLLRLSAPASGWAC